jgi:ABC transporter DrrB family efflux protein
MTTTTTSPTTTPTSTPMAATPTRITPRWFVSDVVGMAGRNLRRMRRTPELLAFSAVQPIMFVLLFRYVFGGAIKVPGVSYVDYLMPGIFVQVVLFGGAATAVGLAEDLRGGVIDRFRTLPMARSAVLAGRTLADLVRNICVVVLMIAVGMLVGFRFHGTVAQNVGGLLLVLFFGYAFSWVFAAVGLAVKDPETAQIAGFIPLFPLVFASSAFVPIFSMPGWLQAFANHQPVSVTVNTTRSLVSGYGSHGQWWVALVWALGILTLCFAVAVHLYNRAAA